MEIENYIKDELTNEQHCFYSFLKAPEENIIPDGNTFLKNEIKELVERHRLIPFFFKNKNFISPSLQEYVANRFLRNSQRMLLFTNELLTINDNCKTNNLNPIFLKGPALAYDLHNDSASRQMIDLDIFIDRNEIMGIHNILLNLGYYSTEIPNTQFRKFILKDNYYFHQEKKISIEIHYRFFPNKSLDKRFKNIFPVLTKAITIQNKEVNVLTTEANILFLVLHGSNHQWFRLFWLKDLADFIAIKKINWTDILEYSKKLGVENALFQSVLLCNLFFNSPIPGEIRSLINKNKTVTWLVKKAVCSIISPIEENFLTRMDRLIYLTKLSNKFLFKANTLIGGALRFIGR